MPTKGAKGKKKGPVKKTAPKGAKRTSAPASRASGLGVLDVAQGDAALKEVRAALAALKPAAVQPPRFNVRLGATVAFGMAQYVAMAGLRPRFERLAKDGEFELARLERLPRLAQATWYIRHLLDRELGSTRSAALPEALATSAQAMRKRMLKVLEFCCEGDVEVERRLAFIRQGTGYQDLADDLANLSALYEEQARRLTSMPEPYRAQDAKAAQKLGAEVLSALGLQPAAKSAGQNYGDLQARAALLLVEDYEEVAAVGRFLTRQDPVAQAHFAPFFTVARAPRTPGSSKKNIPAPPPAP